MKIISQQLIFRGVQKTLYGSSKNLVAHVTLGRLNFQGNAVDSSQIRAQCSYEGKPNTADGRKRAALDRDQAVPNCAAHPIGIHTDIVGGDLNMLCLVFLDFLGGGPTPTFQLSPSSLAALFVAAFVRQSLGTMNDLDCVFNIFKGVRVNLGLHTLGLIFC